MDKKQGQEIKDIRAFLGLTQKEFAEKYHIPLGTLRYWEQGRKMPPYVKDLLWLIAFKEQAMENIQELKEEIEKLKSQ